VLCLCMQLVGYVGSRKWPLQMLLGLFRQCYSAVEIEGPSQLSSALDRLVDNGLLKLKRIGCDEICFGDQLAEAESRGAMSQHLDSRPPFHDLIVYMVQYYRS
jgi:hypothetical protein